MILRHRLQVGCNSCFVAHTAVTNPLKSLQGWVAEWLKAPVLKCDENGFLRSLRVTLYMRFWRISLAFVSFVHHWCFAVRCQLRCQLSVSSVPAMRNGQGTAIPRPPLGSRPKRRSACPLPL